jgi:hypothetical protein
MSQVDIPYYQAARFKNKSAAGAVYNVVQDLIYQDVDCDLSVYRMKLKNVWHVIVVGEKPTDTLHVAIEAQLTNGVLVNLQEDVLLYLQGRRIEAIQIAPWVERHYQIPEE